MGITTVILVPTVAVFGGFMAVKDTLPTVVRYILLHASLVGLTAAASSHPSINFTFLFGKNPEGTFPVWSHLLFYPYLYPLRAYVRLRRIKDREAIFTEVADGLYVGGWPCNASQLPPGNPAVVDCTCELPRPAFSTRGPYLNVRVWDSRGPRPDEIELCVRWCLHKRRLNHSIFIHCAFGHGRSVTMMCALLVASGFVETWQAGERWIKEFRPSICLSRCQMESLRQWTKFREARSKQPGSPSLKPLKMRTDSLSALQAYDF